MADLDAAIGYVVAHGDPVDRARLSWLRSGIAPPSEVLDKVELGQRPDGGWPAFWAGNVASVDATCFRLAEIDDLGGLSRPAARKALRWLARRQRPDGTWQEDESLAGSAPPWAEPGSEEAGLYLTTNAAFWLTVGDPDKEHAATVARAVEAFRASLRPDGTWPSFLVTGWLGAALLYHLGWFYEAAQIQMTLPGPRDREVQTALRRGVRLHRHRDAFAGEVGHDLPEPGAGLAHPVARRHPDVHKGQLGSVRAVPAQLLQAAGDREARRGLVDHEQVDVARLGPHRGGDEVGPGAAGDVGLRAVHDVHIAVPAGVGPDGGHVGAGVRLGDGQRADRLAGQRGSGVPLDQRSVAGGDDVRQRDAMREQGGDQSG